jgi:hypothetical protein
MINFKVIDDSIKHYEKRGFQRIESPWTVTQEVLDITKPDSAVDSFRLLHKNGKGLVASGEQSFLYLYLKGFLPLGRFQTVTPCFRFENFDSLHTKYFIKNELIETKAVSEATLNDILANAHAFFSSYFSDAEEQLKIIKTNKEGSPTSYDICYRGVELGSYGIRSCDFLEWIYGTGVAEPRLSQVIRKFKDKR